MVDVWHGFVGGMQSLVTIIVSVCQLVGCERVLRQALWLQFQCDILCWLPQRYPTDEAAALT